MQFHLKQQIRSVLNYFSFNFKIPKAILYLFKLLQNQRQQTAINKTSISATNNRKRQPKRFCIRTCVYVHRCYRRHCLHSPTNLSTECDDMFATLAIHITNQPPTKSCICTFNPARVSKAHIHTHKYTHSWYAASCSCPR